MTVEDGGDFDLSETEKEIKISAVLGAWSDLNNCASHSRYFSDELDIYTKCKNATGYEILLGNKYKDLRRREISC